VCLFSASTKQPSESAFFLVAAALLRGSLWPMRAAPIRLALVGGAFAAAMCSRFPAISRGATERLLESYNTSMASRPAGGAPTEAQQDGPSAKSSP